MRNFAIIGTGAIGGYYGGLLARSGADVHFLLRSDLDTVRTQGLRVDSPQGGFVLREVRAYGTSADMPTCDVVIVALKATQNHLLPGLLPPLLHDDSTVVLLQNGLNAEPALADALSCRVMAGLAFVCVNKVAPGHIRHLDYGAIRLAQYAPDNRPAGVTPAMEQVATDLRGAGVDVTLDADLLLARWHKLVWNVPYNGLSVLLDATTDQIMGHPRSAALSRALMREVVTGAAAYDRHISEDFVAQMVANTLKMAPYRTSMKLDFDHGRPMEVEAIFGEPLRAAEAQGVELPRLATLYAQLSYLNDRAVDSPKEPEL